jgi:hypothetical protein
MLNSIINKFIISNIKTGNPSYVLTAFVVGIFIVNLKLILSGIEFKGIKMSTFTGTDYATSIASLGGIYGLNKHLNKNNNSTNG